MKLKKIAAAGVLAAASLGIGSAHAVVTGPCDAVSLHSSNVGISTFSCSYDDLTKTFTLTEDWSGAGIGVVQFASGSLEGGVDYTVKKIITNNSNVAWSRFANELLDPAGQANDDLDPKPYPSFVPVGFTTSNDNDGLSFAQGSGLPRTSSVFKSSFADELTDVRDFIDFFDGILAIGGTDNYMTFGLRDNDLANIPFLLVQRPNESSRPELPEPATAALLGIGLLGLAYRRRKA